MTTLLVFFFFLTLKIKFNYKGSDIDTRRRSACDLVKALRSSFQKEVTTIFSQYVATMLNSSSSTNNNTSDQSSNWLMKNTAIYLVTSLAVTSTVERFGATKTNELVDVNDFYQRYILPELKPAQGASASSADILKADAIKYIVMFRMKLNQQYLLNALPILNDFLLADSYVLSSYAALAIERILANRKDDISGKDIKSLLQGLLGNLFTGMFPLDDGIFLLYFFNLPDKIPHSSPHFTLLF